MAIAKHFCGKCGKGFTSETAYLKHLCQATGFNPSEPGHFEPADKEISEKPLTKGKSVVLSEKIIYEAVKKARRKRQANV